ncbi:MAG: PQQ-binding-like beta-propeller repeat protein [Pirellulales bacterium]
MLILRIGLAFATFMGFAIGTAQAQEWSRFRGPNGDGINAATTIPAEWKTSDFAWKIQLPGGGHSSPVLWGNKIFLTGSDRDGGARMIFCLNAADGKTLWSKTFTSSSYHIHVQNSFASGTPVCDAEAVYAAWATPEGGLLTAIDHDGQEKWRFELPGYESQHGFGSSPMLVDDLVILTNDQDGPSCVFAVNRTNGQLQWKIDRRVKPKQNASYATPMLYRPKPGGPQQLIIHSWAHGMSSLDPATGKVHWEKEVFPKRPVGSPIVHAGLMLGNCGEGGGDNSVIAVIPPTSAEEEPKIKFTIDKTMAPYVPSLIAQDDLAYLWSDKGIVSCIRLPEGKKVWQQRVGGNYSTSPVIAGDKLIGVSADGEVVILATGTKYELLGRNKLEETTRATPAIAGGKLFVRTENRLFAIQGKTK